MGGKHGLGTVFKADEAGKATVLYSFAGAPDGSLPYPGVIRDAAGNLYGVTSDGGTGSACDFGCGTVFEVATTGKETILHDFEAGSDGADPASVLLFDSNGNLYGTTGAGGNGECGGTGCGTVYELSPQSDGSWTETVLYVFCSLSGCADGEAPGTGPLVRGANGDLYGTTTQVGRRGVAMGATAEWFLSWTLWYGNSAPQLYGWDRRRDSCSRSGQGRNRDSLRHNAGRWRPQLHRRLWDRIQDRSLRPSACCG